MGTNTEIKLIISTDGSVAIAGMQKVTGEMQKMGSASGGIAEKIKTHWLGLSAAIYSAYETISKGWDLMDKAAAYEEQMTAMNRFAAGYNTTAEAIVESIQKITDGQIAMADIAATASKGLALDVSVDQLKEMAKYADLVGDTLGMSTTEAFNLMATAAERGTEKIMKQVVGIVDLDAALGKNTETMTKHEKQQAMVELMLDKLNEKYSEQGEAVKSTGDKMEQLVATFHNLEEAAGAALLTTFEEACKHIEAVAAGVVAVAASTVSAVAGTKLLTLGLEALVAIASKVPAILATMVAVDFGTRMGEKIEKDTDLWGIHAAEASLDILKKATAEEMKYTSEQLALRKSHQLQMQQLSKDAIKDQEEWHDKILQTNTGIDATTKEINALQSMADTLREKYGFQNWISEDLDIGISSIKNKYTKEYTNAFEDLMMDILIARKTGIDKDLAEVDKWLYESAIKFKGSEDAITALMEAAEGKRLEIEKKYSIEKFETIQKNAIAGYEVEKSQYEDLIRYAQDYRTELVKTYEDAAAEAQKYYNIAEHGAEVSKSQWAYLGGLNAPKLSTDEQLERDKELFLAASSSAFDSGDIDKIDAAFKQGQAYIDRAKGVKDIFGFDMDISTVTDELKGLASQTDRLTSNAQASGDAWQTAANRQIAAIQSVDEWLQYLQGQVVTFGDLISQARELKIDTSMAVDQIDLLIAKVQAYYNLLGNPPVPSPMPEAGSGTPQPSFGGLDNSGVTSYGSEPPFYPNSQPWADWASLQNWGSYAVGTDYVPKTGPYILHKGEAVIPAAQNNSKSVNTVINFSLSPTIMAGSADAARQIDSELARMFKDGNSQLQAEMKKREKLKVKMI